MGSLNSKRNYCRVIKEKEEVQEGHEGPEEKEEGLRKKMVWATYE